MRTGKELVTGIPNFNTNQCDGITIHETLTVASMGTLAKNDNESNEDYCDRCIKLADTMIERLNVLKG